MNNFDVRMLPKISLHDHLDGGLRPQTIIDIAKETGVALPTEDAAEIGRASCRERVSSPV